MAALVTRKKTRNILQICKVLTHHSSSRTAGQQPDLVSIACCYSAEELGKQLFSNKNARHIRANFQLC